MNGWVDGWMNGWVNGWMNVQLGSINEYMEE